MPMAMATQPTTTPFRVALYLDHSRVPYPGERSNTNTYWIVTQPLGAGLSLELSSRSTAVASGAITGIPVAGRHTVYAQVDSYSNLVPETDETNNILGPVYVNVTEPYRIYLPITLRAYASP